MTEQEATTNALDQAIADSYAAAESAWKKVNGHREVEEAQTEDAECASLDIFTKAVTSLSAALQSAALQSDVVEQRGHQEISDLLDFVEPDSERVGRIPWPQMGNKEYPQRLFYNVLDALLKLRDDFAGVPGRNAALEYALLVLMKQAFLSHGKQFWTHPQGVDQMVSVLHGLYDVSNAWSDFRHLSLMAPAEYPPNYWSAMVKTFGRTGDPGFVHFVVGQLQKHCSGPHESQDEDFTSWHHRDVLVDTFLVKNIWFYPVLSSDGANHLTTRRAFLDYYPGNPVFVLDTLDTHLTEYVSADRLLEDFDVFFYPKMHHTVFQQALRIFAKRVDSAFRMDLTEKFMKWVVKSAVPEEITEYLAQMRALLMDWYPVDASEPREGLDKFMKSFEVTKATLSGREAFFTWPFCGLLPVRSEEVGMNRHLLVESIKRRIDDVPPSVHAVISLIESMRAVPNRDESGAADALMEIMRGSKNLVAHLSNLRTANAKSDAVCLMRSFFSLGVVEPLLNHLKTSERLKNAMPLISEAVENPDSPCQVDESLSVQILSWLKDNDQDAMLAVNPERCDGKVVSIATMSMVGVQMMVDANRNLLDRVEDIPDDSELLFLLLHYAARTKNSDLALRVAKRLEGGQPAASGTKRKATAAPPQEPEAPAKTPKKSVSPRGGKNKRGGGGRKKNTVNFAETEGSEKGVESDEDFFEG